MSGIVHGINSQFPQSFTIQMPFKVLPVSIITHWFDRHTNVNKVRRSSPLSLSTYHREDEVILSVVPQTSTVVQIFLDEIDWTRLSLCIRRDGMNDTSLGPSLLIFLPFKDSNF